MNGRARVVFFLGTAMALHTGFLFLPVPPPAPSDLTPRLTVEWTRPTATQKPEPSRPKVMDVPAPATPVSQANPPAKDLPAPEVIPEPEPPAPGPLPSPPPSSPPEGPMAEPAAPTLDELFRIQVRDAVAFHQRYPAVARTRGLEGTVVVQFEIDAQGRLIGEPRVTRTSTHPRLDRAAVEAVLAATYPTPPSGRAVWSFDLPMEYRLR